VTSPGAAPEPAVNDLIRGTAPAAEQTAEQVRQEALVTAARGARARNPETVAHLLAAQQAEDPQAAVVALRLAHPDLFSPLDLGPVRARAPSPRRVRAPTASTRSARPSVATGVGERGRLEAAGPLCGLGRP